ncbi:Cloroperoxidase [Fusarium albosuccineum]|uniref:Cloroperoxidase n=1 Tax=Fusarium albosuccineum TaxID=1237068 RepID=A0A8H4LQU5_9HYPO|nr:Cloroperoxidase [Fusarium albosuccineum]
MKFSSLSFIFAFASASASPQYGYGSEPLLQWRPAGPSDFRGPCPMLNTLANHGFLLHDGRAMTEEAVVTGLKKGLNFEESTGKFIFKNGLVANPTPNATFFTLDQLNKHNLLEHDASLRFVSSLYYAKDPNVTLCVNQGGSRLDAYHGNNHIFNQEIFDQTKAWWTDDIVDMTMLANSKLFRQLASRATNPNYTFTTAKTEPFSLGEVSGLIVAFGNIDNGTVRKDFMEYFFENERLPTVLGWSKKTTPVTNKQIFGVAARVADATTLLADGNVTSIFGRRDLHAGR